ncbi:beta-lactamase-like protein [Blakeslea trispora]|nr:beta-lactamase-like protein [Blakeslea trispora]
MVNIGIVGVGLVGSELVSQIAKSSRSHLFKVVGLTTSQKMVLSDTSYSTLSITQQTDNLRSTVNATGVQTDLQKFADYLASAKEHSVIIDCTASEQVAHLYPSWLRSGLSVVTPNKKGFSSSLDLYKEIQALAVNTTKEPKPGQKSPLVYHEATVGAGLPVLSTLSDLLKTGDEIEKIEGIFSGTLSYLFNNFSSLSQTGEVKSFSEIVRVAKDLGYTEPDPRDDLNGMDVGRKVTICGRLAGLELDLSTLPVENIVPEALQAVQSTEEFMARLPEFDQHFADLNAAALKENQVLRYVGLVDLKGGQSGVKLIKYPASHPFASLQGSDNIIKFTTKYFPSGIIIQGSGAGAAVTAYGIFTDLLRIQERVQCQDVGRSCILVTIGGKNIMFDCGMHMGYQDRRRFPDFSYISKTGNYTDILDAVIISHFHLDHCGALPFFTEMCGYDGPIYMTHPTKAICPILLEDYRKITVERKGETNFFTSDMIKNCMKKVIPINLHQTIKVDDDIEIKAYYAGHVLGAAMIYVRVGQESVVYTGDYNMTPDRHLGSAWIDKVRPDVLITESTYATTIRDSKRSRERDFLTKVHDCVANGGNVIIPVFALGRAQELCILIESYWDRMGLDIPIYFSTGLTERATEYYKLFINWTNQKIKSTFAQRNAFDFKHIKPWHKTYLDSTGPMVLFATPGMLNAGTSLQVFQKWAPDPKNMVIMPGYCVAGTVGAKVLLGQKVIEVDKYTKFEVNLQVRNLSFSAHADAKGIMQLIRMCEPRNVVLVHGERGKMDFLRSNIMKEFGIACYLPANGCSIKIETSRALQGKISTDLLKSLLPLANDASADLCPATSVPIHATLLMHVDKTNQQKNATPTIEIVKPMSTEAKQQEDKKTLCFHVEKQFHVSSLLSDIAHTDSTAEDLERRVLDLLQFALIRSVGSSCQIQRDVHQLNVRTISLWLVSANTLGIRWNHEDEDLASFVLGTVNTVLYDQQPFMNI